MKMKMKMKNQYTDEEKRVAFEWLRVVALNDNNSVHISEYAACAMSEIVELRESLARMGVGGELKKIPPIVVLKPLELLNDGEDVYQVRERLELAGYIVIYGRSSSVVTIPKPELSNKEKVNAIIKILLANEILESIE